jgi:hypothetical protein
MSKPDTGIVGITREHLDGLRQEFDCYYSHIFKAMYGVERIDNRLVNLLLWSVDEEESLPSKEKLLEYQAQFDEEDKILGIIRDMTKNKD